MADCKSCEYCKDYRRYGNIRGSFHCKHPNYEHIRKYFEEHNIRKMVGFIGFGVKYSSQPSVKGSPKWCPKRVEVQDEN